MIAHAFEYEVDYGQVQPKTTGICYTGIPIYTELLSFKLNMINYTSISLGADSPYACYIDKPYSNTPCIYDSNGITSNTYAPALGVQSSFSYVESQGSPEEYFSLLSLMSSLVPSGTTGGRAKQRTAGGRRGGLEQGRHRIVQQQRKQCHM